MKKVTIYFATFDKQEINRIRNNYGINGTLSVNGEIDCELHQSVIDVLEKQERSLIQIRRKIR